MSTVTTTTLDSLRKDLIWQEEFNGDLSRWNDDDLIKSSEHRTDSAYLNPVTGEVDLNQPWNKVPMRHAALYTAEYRHKCQYIEDGKLVMMGHAVKKRNLWRDNFVDAQDKNFIHRYGDFELHGGWLSTKERFRKGCLIDVRINLESQCMRAHRFSIWLVATNGKMYQTTVQFCEIDLLEAEDAPSVEGYPYGNHGLMKIVGGFAGDTAGGQVDFDRVDLKINIRKGWHTISLQWNLDGSLGFYCDDKLCIRDDRTKNTPPDGVTMEAQLILSDEMTSGVKSASAATWQNRTTGPKVPRDDGLFGHSVIRDVDQMPKHKVYVDYIRVYKITDEPIKKEDDDMALVIAEYVQAIENLNQIIDDKTSEIQRLTDNATKTREAVAHLLNL